METKKNNKHIDRRSFLHSTMALGSVIAFPSIITSGALGNSRGGVPASERIIAGGIGVGGRGSADLSNMIQHEDVQFVAICDVQRSRRESVKQTADNRYGNSDCKMYIDFREFLAERPDIDLILTATGDRNHSLVGTCAMKAGKDVYSEKPGSLFITQGRVLADTQMRYGRVYQSGCQRISEGNFIFANELLRLGRLGDVKIVRAQIASFGNGALSVDWLEAQPEPEKEELWWDGWLGSAPWRPYNSSYTRSASAWANIYDFHSGNIGEWGSHTFPQCMDAIGCRNTQATEYIYNGPESPEVGMVCRFPNGVDMILSNEVGTCGVRYEGSEGWVQVSDGGLSVSTPSLMSEYDKIVDDYVGRTGHPADHMRDLLNCVKSRRQTIATGELMHRSMSTVHAANICRWLRRDLRFDPVKEEFINDEYANRLRSRVMREPWTI